MKGSLKSLAAVSVAVGIWVPISPAASNQSHENLLDVATCVGMAAAWAQAGIPGGSATSKEAIEIAHENYKNWALHLREQKNSAKKAGSLPGFKDLKNAQNVGLQPSLERLRAGDFDSVLANIDRECVPIMPEVRPFTMAIPNPDNNPGSAAPDPKLVFTFEHLALAEQCKTMAHGLYSNLTRSRDVSKESKQRAGTTFQAWSQHSKKLERALGKRGELGPAKKKQLREATYAASSPIRSLLQNGDFERSVEMIETTCFEAMPEVEPYTIN